MPSTPNQITITCPLGIQNAARDLMLAGKMVVIPVQANGSPQQGTVAAGPMFLASAVRRDILNGQLTEPCLLDDPATTDPTGIGYTFIFTDSTTKERTVYPCAAITADGSGNFDLANLKPGVNYPAAQPVVYVPGPPGPAGGEAAPLELLSGVTISASLAIAVVGGVAVLADHTNLAHRGCVIGLAPVTALSGTDVEIQFADEFTFSSWAWTLGQPVLLGLNGALTQTVPTTGFLQVIGTPLSSTSLLIDIQAPITLA